MMFLSLLKNVGHSLMMNDNAAQKKPKKATKTNLKQGIRLSACVCVLFKYHENHPIFFTHGGLIAVDKKRTIRTLDTLKCCMLSDYIPARVSRRPLCTELIVLMTSSPQVTSSALCYSCRSMNNS